MPDLGIGKMNLGKEAFQHPEKRNASHQNQRSLPGFNVLKKGYYVFHDLGVNQLLR